MKCQNCLWSMRQSCQVVGHDRDGWEMREWWHAGETAEGIWVQPEAADAKWKAQVGSVSPVPTSASLSRTHAGQLLCSKPLLPIWLFLSLSFCAESDSLSFSCSCRTSSSSVSMIFRSSSSWRSPSSSSSSLELLMSLKISLSSSRWAGHAKRKKPRFN